MITFSEDLIFTNAFLFRPPPRHQDPSKTYNVAVAATNSPDSGTALLRAYLDAVTLSEGLQTRLWHAAELTLTQVRALRRLAKEPKSLGQLGEELALTPPSVTHLVDRLEKRGLIERSRLDSDRRKITAVLTAEGRRLASAVPVLEGTAIRAAVDRIGAADRRRITTAFRDFSAAVRRVEEESLLVEAER
jgi:DNA-binding MarR family transcriptional regulator